jgi:ABC-2 type transport system ATP-binding protein
LSVEPAVTAQGVSRAIGARLVLDRIDLSVSPGEIFGVIGRNGAGKTTLIECIAGLQAPTSGRVTVFGLDPSRDRAATTRRVAVQSQSSALLPALTVRETLELFASFHARPRPIAEVIGMLGLDAVTGERIGHLSGGEGRRLQIALALLPRASLVILDEPSAAVDPEGRAAIEHVIRSLARDGVTVLLSTHDMSEAEQWCDRVAVLDRGRVTALGSPADLIDQHRGSATVSFSLRDESELPSVRVAAAGATVEVGQAIGGGRRVRIETDDVDGLVRRLTFARGVHVSGLNVERRGLAALYFDV